LVIQHEAQRHLPPARRNFGQVLRQRIIEIELVFVGQHHHGDRGELLADRADLEPGLRLGPHAVFERGDSIAFDIQGFAVLHDGERYSRNILPAHLGFKIAVDCRCRIRTRGLMRPGLCGRRLRRLRLCRRRLAPRRIRSQR
jgi:hypothetical protein